MLRDRLEGSSRFYPSERLQALALCGKGAMRLFADPTAWRWAEAYAGSLDEPDRTAERVIELFWYDCPEKLGEHEIRHRLTALSQRLVPKEQGKALLVKYVAEAIAELEGRLEVLEEVEQRDRELAAEAAAVDTSPEGMRRLRYEMSHERAFRAALKELRALQAERPGPGDAIGAGHAAGK